MGKKQISDITTSSTAIADDDLFEIETGAGLSEKMTGSIVKAAMFPGAITMYGGAVAPTGWILCDGGSLGDASSGADYASDDYEDLYDIIQDTYGGTYNWANHDVVNLPDCRGIFIRGAGSNGTLSDAGSTAFSGTLGTYQNDKMQGHKHDTDGAAFWGYDISTPNWELGAANVNTDGIYAVGDPITDGSNGTPRTGTETNPANLSLTYIIKY